MKTEKIFASIFLAGVLFKFMHWPGGGVLIVLTLSFLAILYMLGAFYFFSDKTIKQQNLPLSIVSGIFLSFSVLGVMFKLQYWPGSQAILFLASISALVLLIVTFRLKSKAPEELMGYYKNMMQRTTVLTILAVMLSFTPVATLLKIQYWNNPEIARLKTLYYSNPGNEEYKKQHDEYMSKLSNEPVIDAKE